MILSRQWHLALKILPFVLIAVGLKIFAHHFNLEILSLSPLFSGVVGATVFLLGFMIAGTLSDYKESERLPSDLAACLYSIKDEFEIALKGKGKKVASACKKDLELTCTNILKWLRGKVALDTVLESISGFNQRFIELEPHVQATFINRLKSEQNQARRIILRIQTIRETTFVNTGYVIAELSTFLLLLGLILTKNQPFIESIFFVGFITFILTYMIALIADLDNPFNYKNELESNEISLKELENLKKNLIKG